MKFVGKFFVARSQNLEKVYYLSRVCLSVRMEQLAYHWMDFDET
jgi:hypothetical protein